MSKEFYFVDVHDVFQHVETNLSWRTYSNEYDNNAAVIDSILLFPTVTARTNVMIKGRDGRFISYRDLADANVKAAVELLRPFPNGGH